MNASRSEPLIVVGNGYLGGSAAHAASRIGVPVTVIDPGLTGAATPAAAGLVFEPWLPKLVPEPKAMVGSADRLFGWERLRFSQPSAHSEARFSNHLMLSPVRVVWGEVVAESVELVEDGMVRVGGQEYRGNVFVAAGVWSESLIECPKTSGKAGLALFYFGSTDPVMAYLSGFHYQHAYLFNRELGVVYFSDGRSRDAENWDESADRKTLDCANHWFGLGLPERSLRGLRPYTKEGPWFLRLGKRLWAAGGTYKLGSLYGPWFAERLMAEAY